MVWTSLPKFMTYSWSNSLTLHLADMFGFTFGIIQHWGNPYFFDYEYINRLALTYYSCPLKACVSFSFLRTITLLFLLFQHLVILREQFKKVSTGFILEPIHKGANCSFLWKWRPSATIIQMNDILVMQPSEFISKMGGCTAYCVLPKRNESFSFTTVYLFQPAVHYSLPWASATHRHLFKEHH